MLFFNALFGLSVVALRVEAREPLTRSTVQFEIHLANGDVNAIGVGGRSAILINGSFVGPTLHAQQHDDVEFLVRNFMKEDTTIHFHGIAQKETPWSDGVPGLTQQQIRPGASYLYRWTAAEAGAYFYHAHTKAQMMDGLYGGIIITPEADARSPFGLINGDVSEQQLMREAERKMTPVFVSDWSQYTSSEFQAIEAKANVDLACIDAIIINGVGSQYCLDKDTLDSYTHPVVLAMLRDIGEDHLTDKGCIPPLQVFQGDYDLRLDALPPGAYRECVGGESDSNFTVSVNASLGWTALSFVNPGGLYPLQLSIDNHELIVFAVDGHYIHPITADRILVNTGSRISVMIKLDQPPAQYAIRVANDYLNQVLAGFAGLAYDGTTSMPSHAKPKMDYAGHPLDDGVRSFIPEHSKPFPPTPPARLPDRTFRSILKKLPRPFGAYQWTLTGTQGYNLSHENLKVPLLEGGPSDVVESELILRTNKDDWVDIILQTSGPFAQAHPMHKHGNKVYRLGSGKGSFPWNSVEEALEYWPAGTFNFEDPPYLDTFNTVDIEGEANDTWTVIRYHAESPGAWLFHCHVQTHLSGGMGLIILDGVDDFPHVPLAYREWNGFEPPAINGDGWP
jgi:FtsP/CotA-like multicopper oxidase with cupredoxin domain